MHRLLIASLFTVPMASSARADVASERVSLVTGAGNCGTNSTGFRRVIQKPDGSQIQETGEFLVPYGQYLEITNIEYTTPYWTPWAKFYVQSIDFNIRQRFGTASTNILSAKYNNRTIFSEDATDNFVAIGEYTAPGTNTHVVAFPIGPLIGSQGHLCVTPSSSNNFFMYGGSIRVRGRLIPSGEPPMMDPSPPVLSP